ncbi:MAG: DUF2501 domain-containing protein [Massilia sp.]
MNIFSCRRVLAAAFVAALLPVAPAQAQLEGLINKGGKTGSAGGLGNLGDMANGLSGQAIAAGSTGNVAGVLQYCISNNYLRGGGASAVKDKLLGKLSGDATPTDSGYQDGAMGLLKSSDGKQLDLRGGGLKAQATRQVCDRILAQGKSMLNLP